MTAARTLALAAVAFTTLGTVGTTQSPEFEVAAVRINTSGEQRSQVDAVPASGRLTITNMPVRDVISAAYDVQLPSLLLNVPEWALKQRVDIVAKADPSRVQDLQHMLQPLLAERFKLAATREMREMDALALVLANRDGTLGPGITKSDAACDGVGTTNRFAITPEQPAAGRSPCGVQPQGSPGRIVARGIEMRSLATYLAPSQRRPIIDQTGLTGRYDINITYTPEAFSTASLAQRGAAAPPNVDPTGPPLATALQEQAGMRLQPTRAPVEVIVITHIEPLIGD